MISGSRPSFYFTFIHPFTIMKTLFLVLSLTASTAFAQSSTAENPKFVTAMTATIDKLKTAKSPDDVLAGANQFERIASAEPREWLAPYWGAYSYMTLAWMSPGNAAKQDGYLEKAEKLLADAERLNANDETAVLGAYVAQARMMVDPMSRWQQYGAAATAGIAKARQINPANPRPYFLEGQSLLYTPEQFGGGKDKACPVLKTAKEKFATFKPTSPIHPNWDESRLDALLAECAK
jgi:hypothetical protein